jgi:hypothetical protein
LGQGFAKELTEMPMSRIHTALRAHCLEKVAEASRNAKISETGQEYEYWSRLRAKWSDLAEFYCPEPTKIPSEQTDIQHPETGIQHPETAIQYPE